MDGRGKILPMMPPAAGREPAGGPAALSARTWGPPLAAALAFLLHLPALARYGWFRDELYYVACSRHPAFGYVDHPPLSIWVLGAWRFLFGPSLAALRLAPALAHALTVLLVGDLARRLGGGRFAQALACLVAALAPGMLGITSVYSMNALDLLLWTAASWLFARILAGERPELWLALGIALGLGLLNKISVMWLGTGMALGLLVTTHRRQLATRWPWLALGLALLGLLPYLGWNAQHGWPTLEFMRNAMREKMLPGSPLRLLATQVPMMGLPGAALAVAALAWAVAGRVGRAWRPLPAAALPLVAAWLAVVGILAASPAARAGYLIASYAVPFAAGAVALERLGRRGWSAALALGVVVLLDLPLLPLSLPLLPVGRFVEYARAVGARPVVEERTAPDELPQMYADMFGWPEMAERVAGVYRALPPAERARCGVFAQNYGEAGALDLFGPALGLPPALSAHNNYWLWGPRGYTGEVMIVLGGSREDLESRFASVTLADSVRCAHCMPYERGRKVWVARGLREPLRDLWPRLKRYI